MSERRLSLAAIRALIFATRSTRIGSRPSQVVFSESSLSRRDLFGLTAIAGFGFSPAVSLAKSMLDGTRSSFDYTVGERRIDFRLHGQQRWVIDCTRFGGRPRLLSQIEPGNIRLTLLDALFPGTLIPADFDCTLRKGALTWQMEIQFQWGRFRSRIPFVRWLAGLEPATGPVSLAEAVCRTGQNEFLNLMGAAVGEFRPDWTFRLKGPCIAGISTPELRLTSDVLTLALLDPDRDSLLENPAPKRTLLTMERQTAPWSVTPSFDCEPDGLLKCPLNSFSSLRLETWEETAIETGIVFLASSKLDDHSAFFETSGAGPISLPKPVDIPLKDTRYACVTQWPDGRQQRAFIARFSEESTWLSVNGCQLAVGSRLETPPFEIIQEANQRPAVRCEPGLHHAHVPMEGAITEPIVLPHGARLHLVATSPRQKTRPALKDTIISPPPPSPSTAPPPAIKSPATQGIESFKGANTVLQACLSDFRCVLRIPGPAAVTVFRPDDLLHLKFEFRNLSLQVAAGQPPQLVRAPGQRAQLVVYFPPQHIAEEAFRDPGERPQLPKPVNALIAGWSQLVFDLPPNIASIPYALPALLDWSQLQQVTAPAAAPPPPPPRRGIILQRFPGALKEKLVIPRSTPQLKRQQSLPKRGTVGEPHWYQVREITFGTLPPPSPLRLATGRENHLVFPAQLNLGQAPRDPKTLTVAPVPPRREGIKSVTAIEAPFRLFLSPSPMAGWQHIVSEKPALRNNRHELWHTRLGVRKQLPDSRWIVDERDDWHRTLRAIWSPDYTRPVVYSQPTPQNPFRMSLDARDRHELVELMANSRKDPSGWPSRVARADHFMMSSLGAWIKLRYAAPRISGIDLVEWQHIAAMGRDQYVKVVREGYLFPFGHKAVLFTITERQFDEAPIKPGVTRTLALLKQREFIVVREPLKSYTEEETNSFPSKGRRFPYLNVHITTLVTPDLDDMTQQPSKIIKDKVAFWPMVSDEPVQFHCIGEDRDGRSSEFDVPMIFVSATAAENPQNTSTLLVSIAKAYESRNTAGLKGQNVAYAVPSRGEDTILHTVSQSFNGEAPISGVVLTNKPRFFPFLTKAEVRIPAVQQLLGTEVPVKIGYAAPYVAAEWHPVQNKGEVFAEVLEKVALGFAPDKVGGLASPNLDLAGLSRKSGPVGGLLQEAATGNFNPGTFFKKAQNQLDPQQLLGQAQILGGIFLGDIIKAVAGALPPQFVTEMLPPDTPDTLKRIKTGYRLETKNLGSDPLKIFKPLAQSSLTITSSIVARVPKPGVAPRDPEFSSIGTLTNFEINLFTFLILTFKELRFTKLPGKKLDVTADLADEPLRFGGPLKFVNTLRKFIPAQGFKDPPSLDITPSGITAGYSLALPNIAVGVFSLENLKLSAGLSIPFTNTPVSVRFGFCSRNDPFNVIVSLFGGGGFIGLELDTSGIRSIEAAIEFGGKISLDLVVAKGVVVVMAGIYFKVSRDGNQQVVELEGYLRAGGALSIIGLITVTVEFRLELSYNNGDAWGRATLVIKVEIAFFSESVEVEFEKRFAGSSSTAALEPNPFVRPVSNGRVHRTQFTGGSQTAQPARIAEVMSPEDWNRYAAAFA